MAAARLLATTTVAANPPPSSQPSRRRKRGRRGGQRAGTSAGARPTRTASGQDLITSWSVSKAQDLTEGQSLIRIEYHASKYDGTRLSQEAALWSRWRPTSLRIRLISTFSSSGSGRLCVAWMEDHTDALPGGLPGLRRMVSLPHVEGNINTPLVLRVPLKNPPWLYLREHDVDGTFGAVVVGVIQPIVGATGKLSLQLSFDWSVQFSGPYAAIRSQPGTSVYADSSWTPYFTTSSGDWDSGYLTLKAHSGGGIVPFPGAKPGSVYKLDPSAHLDYVKADGTTAKVEYASVIKDSPYHGFALHQSFAYASSYQSSGNKQYCLKYTAAGNWVSPNNPAWSVSDSLTDYRSAPSPSLGDFESVSPQCVCTCHSAVAPSAVSIDAEIEGEKSP